MASTPPPQADVAANAADVRMTILGALAEIAPEADLDALAPDVEFRDQLDIDSMDFLNFIIGLHHSFGVEIPEVDYPKLLTLQGCIDYLSPRPG